MVAILLLGFIAVTSYVAYQDFLGEQRRKTQARVDFWLKVEEPTK